MKFLSNKFVIILIAIISLAAGTFLSGKYNRSNTTAITQTQTGIRGMLWPNPKTMSAFELVDQDQQPFTVENLKGHWSLMFFGFTQCPDICPTTMNLLNAVVKELPEDKQVRVLFVSVDPERDTHTHLKDYIAYFNPEFIGLTAEQEMLTVLTRQLGVLAQKVTDTNTANPDDYIMDHSASILLFNPNAEMIGIFSSPHDKTDIKNRYLAIRDFIEKQ